MDQHHLMLLKHSSVQLPGFCEKFNILNVILGVTYLPHSILEADKVPVRPLVQGYYNIIACLFIHPIDKIYQQAATSELILKMQEYRQLKLKEALTKQAAKDLKNIEEGTPAHKTINTIE